MVFHPKLFFQSKQVDGLPVVKVTGIPVFKLKELSRCNVCFSKIECLQKAVPAEGSACRRQCLNKASQVFLSIYVVSAYPAQGLRRFLFSSKSIIAAWVSDAIAIALRCLICHCVRRWAFFELEDWKYMFVKFCFQALRVLAIAAYSLNYSAVRNEQRYPKEGIG